MSPIKWISLVCILLGLGMFGTSQYIQKEIDDGKIQISDAEKKLDQTNKLFSLSPATEDIGQGISRAGKKKIASAESEIAYYQSMANYLKVGGFIFTVVGLGLFFVRRK